MRILAFRPEPGFSRTVAAGAEMGLQINGQPLGEIEALNWEAPAAKDFDGILVGSANVFRNGGEQLPSLRALPAYCVGEASAEAARSCGFTVAHIGSGGLQNVLDGLTGQRMHLLRLTGQERIKLNRTAKVEMTEIAVYAARPVALDSGLADELPGNLVLLHSGATARHFASECSRMDVSKAAVTVAALGRRIAAAAGPGWRAIHCSDRPDDAALLALAAQICKTA